MANARDGDQSGAAPVAAPGSNARRSPAEDDDSGPQLIAYRLNDRPPELVCAPGTRQWMDATDERFANRCLPLLIANQAGWFVLNECPFEASWNGARDPSGVQIRYLSDEAKGSVSSHFGEGIITWHIPFLFRTPPGYNLLVRGPSNLPKDGVQALEGIVETDWSYATFTMNWKLTRTDHGVRFEKDEPICMLVPQRRGELEEFRPETRDLDRETELRDGHREWAKSRAEFLARLRREGSQEAGQKWQKHYFQGHAPHGGSSQAHQTVLSLRPFPFVAPRAEPPHASHGADVGKRPRQKPDYRLEERFGEEILLYHPIKTQALYLNASAALIWELCNGVRSADEITELLREAFPDSAETIEAEVASTLQRFAEQEVVDFV